MRMLSASEAGRLSHSGWNENFRPAPFDPKMFVDRYQEAAPAAPGAPRAQLLASGTAIRGAPFIAHYVASKGAVMSLTRSLARELGCSPATLYRDPLIRALIESRSGGRDLPRGFATSTGDLEAYE